MKHYTPPYTLSKLLEAKDRYECPYCHKRFRYKATYRWHLVEHTKGDLDADA